MLEDVNKSPLNHSPSKMMYSFPKTERFKEKDMNRSKSVGKFYDLPDVLNKRSTSFGIGNRIDLSLRKQIDKFYEIPSNFSRTKPSSEAFTFGISRKYYEKVRFYDNKEVYIPKSRYVDKSIPGPGTYEYIKKLGDDAPHYELYRNDRYRENKSSGNNVVGPGEYEFIQTTKEGKYFVSNLKNIVNCLNFGKKEDQRFINIRPSNLGPGRYEPVKLFNKTGFSFLSTYKSNIAKSMGKKLKIIDKKTDLGPGQYKIFSEFGYTNQNFDFSKSKGRNNEQPLLKRSSTEVKIVNKTK